MNVIQNKVYFPFQSQPSQVVKIIVACCTRGNQLWLSSDVDG